MSYRMSIQAGTPAKLPLYNVHRDLSTLCNQVLPFLRNLVRLGYFSMEVEGAHHVPRSGPTIYVGNHAGWVTIDTLFGALAIVDHVGPHRLPWGAVEDTLLKVWGIGRFIRNMGGFPASWLRNAQALPQDMEVFSVYPEGTEGNCKPFWHAYQMRRWRSGFVRLALARRATIVPVAMIGAEECVPVAHTLRFIKPFLGSIAPVPLSLLPLPSSWKMIFLPPLPFEVWSARIPEGALEKGSIHQLVDELQSLVQDTLDAETSQRPLVRLTRRLRHS